MWHGHRMLVICKMFIRELHILLQSRKFCPSKISRYTGICLTTCITICCDISLQKFVYGIEMNSVLPTFGLSCQKLKSIIFAETKQPIIIYYFSTVLTFE